MMFGELADEYIRLYGAVGRVEWFMDDWKTWVETVRDSVFVDFGDAAGSAQFIDRVIVNAPDLLTPEDRFVLAPQAGAHLAAAFRRDDNSYLNDVAIEKFFLRPLDEFLAARGNLEPGREEFLANNLAMCVGLGVLHLYEVSRPQMADEYNALNERARWDTQNFIAIQVQKERMLKEALTGPIATIESAADRLLRLRRLDDKRRLLVSDLGGSVSEWRSECERLLRAL